MPVTGIMRAILKQFKKYFGYLETMIENAGLTSCILYFLFIFKLSP